MMLGAARGQEPFRAARCGHIETNKAVQEIRCLRQLILAISADAVDLNSEQLKDFCKRNEGEQLSSERFTRDDMDQSHRIDETIADPNNRSG
jgi:hypothetical protein